MRRSMSRALFVFALAASGMAVLLLVASSMRIAYAQVRPGRGGGGGGGGVNLQATTPGAKQTGHANISGAVIIGPANLDTKLVASGAATGGLDISSPANANAGWIRLGGCSTAAQPCLSTINNTALVLGAVVNPVTVDTGGVTRGSGNLLEVRNLGVLRFAVAAVNGATTGMAFATAVTAGAISVGGSSCAILTVSGFTGLGAGGPCIAYADNVWGTLPLSLTCEQASATTVNIRFCNTGVNVVAVPAGTYSARIP